jgi:hypothetical protein
MAICLMGTKFKGILKFHEHVCEMILCFINASINSDKNKN